MSPRTKRQATPTRAVIVTRLSKDTGDNAVNHATQEAGCRKRAEALGLAVVAVYRDDISGDRLDRPGLDQALALIEAGGADTLLTYSTDRLARDQVNLSVIIYRVRRAGGDVLSATEDLAAGPLGDFLRSTYGFAAAMELAKIRERTNRGLQARFAQAGRYKPSRRPLYGYEKHGTGGDATYTPHPTEAPVVIRVWHDAAEGQSRSSIAKRLNAEGLPGPDGQAWHPASITRILRRSVYATGEHECWLTATVRDADARPYQTPRPAEERYVVGGFPVLVDAETYARARAAASRNRWRSRRDDRPAEEGIFRYGFAVCGGCGRALPVLTSSDGTRQYKCSAPTTATWRCPAPVSLSVERVDDPAWWWVQDTISDPRNGARYAVVHTATDPAPETVAALTGAEAHLASLTTQVEGLLTNLGLLSGAAATMAADRLNALNEDLTSATAERDRLAALIARATTAPTLTVKPEDALASAAWAAITAMRQADPDATTTHTLGVLPLTGGTAVPVEVPNTWRAKQAALATLDVRLTINQANAVGPRWTVDMRLPGGAHEQGQAHGSGPYYLVRPRWLRSGR